MDKAELQGPEGDPVADDGREELLVDDVHVLRVQDSSRFLLEISNFKMTLVMVTG